MFATLPMSYVPLVTLVEHMYSHSMTSYTPYYYSLVAWRLLHFSFFVILSICMYIKSRMYFWYGRLDIDALWFKLEAIMPFELGTTAIDRSCLTW